MTELREDKLSAYLDGELSDADARQVEAALARDPQLKNTLDMLTTAEADILQAFDAQLEIPVPPSLENAIRSAPEQAPANSGKAPRTVLWMSAAAALVALVIGGGGGFYMAAKAARTAPKCPSG